MDWLSIGALHGRAATLHDKMARACLPFREAPAEFMDVIVCLSKKGLSDLPDLGHDRIAPYLDRRRVASHYPHLLRVPPLPRLSRGRRSRRARIDSPEYSGTGTRHKASYSFIRRLETKPAEWRSRAVSWTASKMRLAVLGLVG